MSESAKLPRLNIPAMQPRMRLDEGSVKILDPLRRGYFLLTPEEWVRQNFVHWLIDTYHYPASLMANERRIDLNGIHRRCDTVVFSPSGDPLIIIEYKAPDVEITQDVFDQIVRYNMCLHARYLIVSNGLKHYCCSIDYESNTYNFLPRIPSYPELK